MFIIIFPADDRGPDYFSWCKARIWRLTSNILMLLKYVFLVLGSTESIFLNKQMQEQVAGSLELVVVDKTASTDLLQKHK